MQVPPGYPCKIFCPGETCSLHELPQAIPVCLKYYTNDVLTREDVFYIRDLARTRASRSPLQESYVTAGMFLEACWKLAVEKLSKMWGFLNIQTHASRLDVNGLTIQEDLVATRSLYNHQNFILLFPCIPVFSLLRSFPVQSKKYLRGATPRSAVPLSTTTSRS